MDAIAIGSQAGYNTQSESMVAIGKQALYSNTTGSQNQSLRLENFVFKYHWQ